MEITQRFSSNNVMEVPVKGEYTDELYKIVAELVAKMNALDNLQVKGTGISGKLTYSKGQYTLEIQQS